LNKELLAKGFSEPDIVINHILAVFNDEGLENDFYKLAIEKLSS
jgi:hypothetical protein